MKKWFFGLMLCFVSIGYFGFINAQKRLLRLEGNHFIEGDSATERKWAEERMLDSADKATIQSLLKAEKYDSVIEYCNYIRDYHDFDIQTYELATAAAYWPFGDRPKAYEIVMKGVQYDLGLHGGGGNPFDMVCDYTIGLNLAKDKLLEDMISSRVLDYYKSKNNPETTAGIKLIKLNYQMRKLINKSYYMQSLIDPKFQMLTAAQKFSTSVQTQFEEEQTGIFNELKDLLQQNHQKIFTDYQVGLVYQNQINIIKSFKSKDQFDYFDSLLKAAINNKSVTPDEYVNYLVQGFQMQKANASIEEMVQLRDSLCFIYKCSSAITSRVEGDKILSNRYDSTGRMYVDTFYLKHE